jgi:tripeptide aminopeptidase
VVGRRPGSGKRPTLVLSAHLDTVFPEGTDVTVRKEGERYYGRGLSDDSRGLAVNLAVLRALQNAGIRTVGDILFVGTVGEEGLGNLRGVKALLTERAGVDGFISVDGVNGPGEEHVTSVVTQATGSRRWSIKFSGPGGHSFDNFGLPSATHALGRAIARIAELRTPADPKTTFTVGIVSGGSAVNAIAAEAQMQIDLRSNDAKALAELEARVMEIAREAAKEENARWRSQGINVTPELLGDRPAGRASNDSPIVQTVVQSFLSLGMPRPTFATSSTDSNVAIGMGMPAVTLNGGGIGFKFHSPDEWYQPLESWKGPQHVLLTVLGLVGVQGVTKPTLPTRN